MDTLTAMPASFTAGTTVAYTRAVPDMPSSSYGWQLFVYAAGRGTAQIAAGPFTIASNAAGVSIDAAATAPLTPGTFQFQETVKEIAPGTRVFTISRGALVVEANLATATNGSAETIESQILRALEAKVLGRITSDQESVQIDGTAVAHIPFEVAEKLLWKYREIVAAQTNPGAIFGSIEFNVGTTRLPIIPGYPIYPNGGR